MPDGSFIVFGCVMHGSSILSEVIGSAWGFVKFLEFSDHLRRVEMNYRPLKALSSLTSDWNIFGVRAKVDFFILKEFFAFHAIFCLLTSFRLCRKILENSGKVKKKIAFFIQIDRKTVH